MATETSQNNSRLSMVLSCFMHLERYPMDVQCCTIDFCSYAYTDKDIKYKWMPSQPLQIKNGLEKRMQIFDLIDYETGTVSDVYSTSTTGTFYGLKAKLTLKRQFTYYLFQLYIPTGMTVGVSWIGFWLDRSAVPARMTLGLTTLLTMTTKASSINARLPPVTYMKAVDVWITGCMTFIFSSILEFAYVTYVGFLDNKTNKQGRSKHKIASKNGHTEMENAQQGSNRDVKDSSRKGDIKYTADRAKYCDFMSRLLFPGLFIAFNVCYWTIYWSSEAVEESIDY